MMGSDIDHEPLLLPQVPPVKGHCLSLTDGPLVGGPCLLHVYPLAQSVHHHAVCVCVLV